MLKPIESLEDINPQETSEWLEAFDEVLDEYGPDRVRYLIEKLQERGRMLGVNMPVQPTTAYINTIPREEESPYPGDRALERRIKSIIRWNAMAMVVRANKYDEGIGGHVATYQSLATLTEVAFNHFFRAKIDGEPGDFLYYQGHASPGAYARAFVEGRLNEEHLKNFRHELREHPGLSSYPHPWLMPDFWQFPTVSMGIGPLNAIYQARFMRYLENRGLLKATNRKVWAYLGDGEMDEPESIGAIRIAGYERLDNLVFVINCNLQRLDGPVRGNGKIIQELEGVFQGAGWNVIKVVWGSQWDDMLAQDTTGLLVKRMEECVDGDYQTFRARGGDYIREHFFGKYPELLPLVENFKDADFRNLKRGGHDPVKVFNAYKRAVEMANGKPTVILAKTVKGYGIGTGEGANATHQQKKLNEEDRKHFCEVFEIPLSEQQILDVELYRPPDDSPEMEYLRKRREALGGYMPVRSQEKHTLPAPALEDFKEQLEGTQPGREVSTTMAFVRVLTTILRNKELGKYVVPIIPDEARTFGMEALFRQIGIYSSRGQLYTPVDKEMFLYYKEAKDGQILEEGITEAGAIGSFTAAGTAYSNYGVPMIPFFIFYSMFGFQRVGDFIWALADSRCKGFLLGATAGRTTLSGEGLQHQDGHSLLLASTVPTCVSYDPAYAYEIAVIVRDGIRRMYEEWEDVFYYLTVYNDNYVQPAMPEGCEEGILKGLYKYKAAEKGTAKVQLFGSGPILEEVLKAQQILAEDYKVPADVWSATSYNLLRREALSVDRWNRLHPDQEPKTPYVLQALEGAQGPIVASSDYMKAVPDQIAPWLAGRLVTLGTDGFGRSDNREYLRQHFEVNAAHVVAAALSALARDGKFDAKKAKKAMEKLGIDASLPDPVTR